MLSYLANRLHPYSTWVHVAYYVSVLARTSCFSLSGKWIARGFPSSCFRIPLYFVVFLKCEFQPISSELSTVSSKRKDFANYFSLLQWYKTKYLSISQCISSYWMGVRSGICPTDCTCRNMEYYCYWQDKISVKVNFLGVFIDVCSKKQMSVVSWRAATELKHNKDSGFEGVKETMAKCGALLNIFQQMHTYQYICLNLPQVGLVLGAL